MNGYLIGEDGPHAGVVIAFTEGEEWALGRDPDLSFFVLEDPMVSRKHALVTRKGDLFFIENLSSVNPIQVNDITIEEPHQLVEEDVVQIGNNYFRFTTIPPEEEDSLYEEEAYSPAEPYQDEAQPLEQEPLSFFATDSHRFMIKVISGPNQGAEFGLDPGQSYVIGKDAATADIIFQDLSVSRQHAKISVSEAGEAIIEDLESRNGVFVNRARVDQKHSIQSQDLISLGTTSFLFIDKEALQETIFSLLPPKGEEEPRVEEETPPQEEPLPTPKNWKDLFIPTKHLVIASIVSSLVFVGIIGLFSLFKSEPVMLVEKNEIKEIEETLASFKYVQFSFNQPSGKIFLVGHVLTEVDHSELIYLIQGLPFISSIEDNVVVDEGVWESMNALLVNNPKWRGVMVTATMPGKFVLRGYLETQEEATLLQDYVNLNFPYLNLLDNQVVVASTLQTQVQNLLIENNFLNVTFQFASGELIFAGRVNTKEEKSFNKLLDQIEEIRGIRQIKNFVIFTGESTARIDLSSNYKVMGTSRYGNENQYVLINGKILSIGDTLDGMTITGIVTGEVQLDKDGIKYKIDYNQL